MLEVKHKSTGQVYTVYGTDAEGGYIWFLIYKTSEWEWLDAKECA